MENTTDMGIYQGISNGELRQYGNRFRKPLGILKCDDLKLLKVYLYSFITISDRQIAKYTKITEVFFVKLLYIQRKSGVM